MNRIENAAIDRWLADETPEAVLEPELPIIDPHHHLWDLRTLTVEPFLSFEQKVYLCDEIMADIESGGHNDGNAHFAARKHP